MPHKRAELARFGPSSHQLALWGEETLDLTELKTSQWKQKQSRIRACFPTLLDNSTVVAQHSNPRPIGHPLSRPLWSLPQPHCSSSSDKPGTQRQVKGNLPKGRTPREEWNGRTPRSLLSRFSLLSSGPSAAWRATRGRPRA